MTMVNSLTYYLFVLLSIILLASYAWFSLRYRHWKRRAIPFLEPTFPLGSAWNCLTFRNTMGEELASFYKRLAGNDFGGVFIFDRPILLIRDPETIKTILVKDFANFTDHGVHFDRVGDPFSVNLFNSTGQRWRFMRQKMTPAFTSGKMFIFSKMASCCSILRDLLYDSASRCEAVEMRATLSRFTTEVIAEVVFGIDGRSTPEFYDWGHKAFEPSMLKFGAIMLSVLHPAVSRIVPTVARDVTAYFTDIVKKTVQHRRLMAQHREISCN